MIEATRKGAAPACGRMSVHFRVRVLLHDELACKTAFRRLLLLLLAPLHPHKFAMERMSKNRDIP
jgi:hypothetical protein